MMGDARLELFYFRRNIRRWEMETLFTVLEANTAGQSFGLSYDMPFHGGFSGWRFDSLP
jgi:hypothetical protein